MWLRHRLWLWLWLRHRLWLWLWLRHRLWLWLWLRLGHRLWLWLWLRLRHGLGTRLGLRHRLGLGLGLGLRLRNIHAASIWNADHLTDKKIGRIDARVDSHDRFNAGAETLCQKPKGISVLNNIGIQSNRAGTYHAASCCSSLILICRRNRRSLGHIGISVSTRDADSLSYP